VRRPVAQPGPFFQGFGKCSRDFRDAGTRVGGRQFHPGHGSDPADPIPFFTSDQLPEYDDALLHAFGVWVQPERKGKRGRYPQPRLVPTTDLLYAQVVKVRAKGRVTEVKTKVIFGNFGAKRKPMPTSRMQSATCSGVKSRLTPSHALAPWRGDARHELRDGEVFPRRHPG